MEDGCEAKWAREPGAAQAAEGLVLRGVQIYSKPDPRAAWQRVWWAAGVPVGCRAGTQGVGGGALPEVGPWDVLSLAAEHTWICELERLWGWQVGDVSMWRASEPGAGSSTGCSR